MATSCVVLLSVATESTIAATPSRVRTSKRQEIYPVSEGGFFAWSRSRTARSNRFDAIVKPAGRPAFRANVRGTQGFTGGISGGQLVFQQVRRGQSELRSMNLRTRRRTSLPRLNTRLWEWRPTRSGSKILFGRRNLNRNISNIVLANLKTHRQRTLATVRGRRAIALPGQVNGDFAAWTLCRRTSGCDVFRYRISTGNKLRIGGRRQQYNASVSDEGAMYYGRSGRGCGTQAVLVRRTPQGRTSVIYRPGGDRDVGTTYVRDGKGRKATVFFERAVCGRNIRFDIYKLRG